MTRPQEIVSLFLSRNFPYDYVDVGMGKQNSVDVSVKYTNERDFSNTISNYKKYIQTAIGGIIKEDKRKKVIIVNNIKINLKKYIDEQEIKRKLTTAIQEKASVFIFNRALVDNVTFNSWEDIKNDKETIDGLRKIFKTFGEPPDSWIQSYYRQQEKLLKEFGKNYWDKFEYDESGNFMDFIKDILKEIPFKGKRLKYENWSPADIWMIKNKNKVIQEIKDNISKNSITQTIYELNDILRDLILKKELIGVSLKKVTNETAKFVYVNIKSPTLNLDTEIDSSSDIKVEYKFNVEQARVKLGKNSIQIKSNSGAASGESNLKFESLISGSGGRGGKAPVDLVSELLDENFNNVKFENDYSKYPFSSDDYEKQKDYYERMFDYVKSKVTSDIQTKEKFSEKIKELFDGGIKEKRIGRIKLMQLSFLNDALQIENQNELWTDLMYLTLKKGKHFAPHAKLY